jgi:hypothetical protein
MEVSSSVVGYQRMIQLMRSEHLHLSNTLNFAVNSEFDGRPARCDWSGKLRCSA